MPWGPYTEHIDRDGKLDSENGECCACDKTATHFVNIRSGPMRGTDIDTYYVCPRHIGIARKNLDRFYAHLRTKNRFLKRITDGPPSDAPLEE